MDEEKIFDENVDETQSEEIAETKEDLNTHEADNHTDLGRIESDIAALREQISNAFNEIEDHRKWIENIMKGTGAVLHDDGVSQTDESEDEIDEIAEADRRWYEAQKDYIV